MKKRILTILVSMAMVTVSLAGCSGNGTKETTPETTQKQEADKAAATNAPSSDEEINLRFSWWGGDERNAATLEVIEQFQKLHPNVTIEAEYGGNDGYHDKLATQLASGTAPDIVQVDPEIFPTYIAAGDYFYDFNDFDMDLSEFEPAYLSMPINGYYNDQQLGLPSGISGQGILVNKDLADAIGLDFTKQYTWDDLIEMGKKVREYDDSLYLICANKEYVTNIILFNYTKQLIGNTLFDPETKSMNLTEDQLKQALDYVQKLYDEGVVAPASYQASYSGDNLQSDANWIAGKYVTCLTYVSTIDVMTAANPNANYYMSQLPLLEGCSEKGWSSNTSQVFAVSKTCAHPEMAVEFMNYFFNGDQAIETLRCTRSVPPTEKARKLLTEKDLLSESTMEGANIAAAMGGKANDKISSSQESKAIFFDSVETIGYGANDPASVAKDAMSLLSELSN